MSEEKKEVTNVQEVDIDIDEILGFGAESVMTADEQIAEKKPNVFSPMDVDTSFLDKPAAQAPKSAEPVEPKTEDSTEPVTEENPPAEEDDGIDPLAPPTDNFVEEEPKNKGGRPAALISATKKLIDKGVLFPFEDDKKLEDYSAEDFEELLEANFEQYTNKMGQEVAGQFFQALPPEMQQAYDYIANGGTDLKGMFSALAASREVYELNIDSERGQKEAIRSYLNATGFGTPEEIEDEIYAYEDRGDLEKKAKQFKPKLDAMQQQIVNQRIAEQENQAAMRKEQSQRYIESVYSALEPGKLNDLDLDNRTQNMLYAGLVQSNYPSINGKQTNMLGHLLEKYQWVEPRHDLIAEALWLLADPDGYKDKVRAVQDKETNAKVLRTLKTEQSTKSVASQQQEETQAKRSVSRGIPRQKRNFFGR
jgi:hypothetical protein